MGILMRIFTRISISLLLTAGAIIIGCSGAETVTRPPPPPVAWETLEPKPPKPDAGQVGATSKERAAADAYLKALSAASFGSLGALLDEDARFSFAGQKDVHGRDNILKMHEALFSTLTARSFVPERQFSTDGAQIVEWIGKGIKNGNPVTFRGLAILATKDDGTIANVALYFDETLPAANPPPGSHLEVEQARSTEETTNVGVVRTELDALETKDAGASVLRGIYKSIAHIDISVDDLWGVGSYVIAAYHVTGEQKKDLIKLYVVDVIELQDGKISNFRRYANTAQQLALPR
jgi:ketosteroid isomerase-like protein